MTENLTNQMLEYLIKVNYCINSKTKHHGRSYGLTTVSFLTILLMSESFDAENKLVIAETTDYQGEKVKNIFLFTRVTYVMLHMTDGSSLL